MMMMWERIGDSSSLINLRERESLWKRLVVFTQINLIELKSCKRFSSVSLSLERIGFGISLWNMIT